jgi:hypothetical protein
MRWFGLVAGLMLVACAPPRQQGASVIVYERVNQLSNDVAFQTALAMPSRRIREFTWLTGDWQAQVTVFATAHAPESRSETRTRFRMQGDDLIVSDDLSTVLVYDGFARRWVTAGFEPPPPRRSRR